MKKQAVDKLMEKAAKSRRHPFRTFLSMLVAFTTAYSLISPAVALDEEEAEDMGLLPEETAEVTEEVPYEEPAPVYEEVPEVYEEPAPAYEEEPTEVYEEPAPVEEETAEPVSEEPAPAEETVTEEAPAAEAPAEEQPAVEEQPAAAEKPAEEEPAPVAPSKTEYVYVQEGVLKATAIFADPSVIPDEAELVVTEVEESTAGYNYEAYLGSLNLIGDNKDYTSENTSLYDVAFVLDGKELSVSNTAVTITFEFYASQLSDMNNFAVWHLPLADSVRNAYPTTKDAVNINAYDVAVEPVTVTALTAGYVQFVSDGFSVYAFTTAEEKAVEPAAVEETEEPAAAEPVEEENHEPLTFKDSVNGLDVKVTAEYDAFPEEVTMSVKMVSASEVEESVSEAVDGKVRKVEAVDITFKNADGDDVQPIKPIQVVITPSEAPKQAEDVAVVHIDDAGEATVVEGVDTTEEAVVFEAESFSTYVVVYTVDFEYTVDGKVFTYSMAGGTTMSLKALIIALGIETAEDADLFINEVADVTFSNPELVRITKNSKVLFFGDNDWTIESLQPFNTDEYLTITMNDGQSFEIHVTDAQGESTDLKNFLTDAIISAPKNEQGEYIVAPGESYSITLSFKEKPDLQFDNNSMTYAIPDGLKADGHEGKFSVNIERGGATYTIAGNDFSINNGVLTVSWNKNDPNYNQLTAAANVKFSLAFDGTFDENAKEIKFSDEIIKHIEVDTSSSVKTSKSANVDVYNDKIYYTATVTSEGISKNVVLTDTITGTGVTLDPNSIQATSSTGQPVSMTGGASGNTFTYTIPSMKNGEIITFRYAANIDPSVLKLVDRKVVTQSGNTFKATSDGDPEGDTTPINNTIDYTPTVDKANGVVTGTDGTKQTVSWSLTVNPQAKVSAAGVKVTDTIGAGSQSIMKYSGDGITVAVRDARGNLVRTDTVPWSNLDSKTDSAWTYTIPTGDRGHAYKYEITYTTEVETKDLKKLTNVDNTVHTDGDKEDHGSSQVGPTDGGVELKKEAVNVDKVNKEVTWKVTFVVPGTGLDKAVVTDYYPHQWVGSSHEFERVKEGSVTVTGLTDGEDWNIQYDDAQATATITFTKDGTAGLKGTGSARTVTVILKTEISDAWVTAAAEESWRIDHTNRVELDFGDKLDTSATVKITPNHVQKTSTETATRTVDGVELPVYKYEVVLSGIETDSFTITDSFNTEILEPFAGGNDAFYVYGGDQYYQGNRGVNPVSYINTTDGMDISVNADSLPKDGDKYYTAYKLVYYLTVKNQAAMNKLMQMAASSEDGKATLNNTVDWEGQTDTTPVVYTYNGLDKEILTSDEELKQTDKDIYADFRITLNPAAEMMNGGEPLTMTDTVSNLSVVLTSIQATPAEGVSWDMSGNTVTYTIPDATKVVITYRARVIFTSIGETGETVAVDFSNVAEMKGYRDEINKTAERHNSGQGSGSVPRINLLKYEAGNMTKRLEGAVFVLLDENKNPVKDKNGVEVSFTTDGNGLITVEGDQEKDGWAITENKRYYLRETVAPAGYKLANFDYSFQISDDGTTDYEKYIYHTGDTMSAKNYPGTDVDVAKIWSAGNENCQDNDHVIVKLQQKIGDGDWSYTIRRRVKEVWEDAPSLTLTLNNANEWKGKFDDLPVTVPPKLPEEEGVEFLTVEYRVVETKAVFNGKEIELIESGENQNVYYHISKEGGTYISRVTNKVEDNGSLKISKTVTENGLAPTSDIAKSKLAGTYTFTIYTDEACTTAYQVDGAPKTVTLTIAEDGAAVTSDEVTNMPVGDYWIKETVPTNGSSPVQNPVKVTVEAGKTGEEAVVATFTNNYVTVNAQVKKVWVGSNKLPPNLVVTLYADDTATEHTVTLDAAHNWTSDIITGLPKYKTNADGTLVLDAEGKPEAIGYHWVEGVVPSGFFLTNSQESDITNGKLTTLTNTYQEFNLSTSYVGTKTWKGASRPETLKVVLYANGKATSYVPKWTNKDTNVWSYEFENLPVFDADGNAIKYTAKEELTGSYTQVTDETTSEETEYVQGTPESHKVTPCSDVHITLNAHTDLGYAIIKLTGNEGFVIWTHRAPTPTERTQIDAEGAKEFGDYSHKKRLYYNGVGHIDTPAGTIDVDFDETTKKLDIEFGDSSTWAWLVYGNFKDAKYNPGTTKFVNKFEDTSLEVDKKWLNPDGTDADWPEGVTVTVQLTADGEAVTGKTAELNAENTSYTFENLPKYKTTEDGQTEIVYSVEELSVPGYTSTVDTIAKGRITITNSKETTSVEVDKKWANADGSDTWPEGVTVTVQLTADGKEVTGKTATLSADKPSYKFDKLPKYRLDETGKEAEIVYSVKEVTVAGYTSEVGTLTEGKITVTNTQKTTSVEVDKKWANADGSDTWPEGVTVTVQLTADGKEVTGKTATLSADKPSYKFDKLPKYRLDETGKEAEIVYSVKEVTVAGYTSEVGTLTEGKITVTNTQKTTSVEVDKKWANADGSDTWPEGVTVTIQLTADGKDVAGKTATLSADKPSYKFDKLPKYRLDETGKEVEIVYSVKEVAVAGYTSEVGTLTEGKITVTNTQKTTSVEVDKKWANADGSDTWPEGVTVTIQLTADGKDVAGKTATLSADKPSYKFDKLPKYRLDETGKEVEIVYSVKEVAVAGYTSEVGTLTEGKITVTNTQKTHISRSGQEVGKCGWQRYMARKV